MVESGSGISSRDRKMGALSLEREETEDQISRYKRTFGEIQDELDKSRHTLYQIQDTMYGVHDVGELLSSVIGLSYRFEDETADLLRSKQQRVEELGDQITALANEEETPPAESNQEPERSGI